MKLIDRLIKEARKATQGSGKGFAVGSVDYDEETGIYTAVPHAWEGAQGSGTALNGVFPEWWCSEYPTEKAASDALNRLFSGFGISEENSVIYAFDYGIESG